MTQCQSEIEGYCPCENTPVIETVVDYLGPCALCLHCYRSYYDGGFISHPKTQPIGYALLKHVLHYWYADPDKNRSNPLMWQYLEVI